MKTKQQKRQSSKDIKDRLEKSKITIFTSYARHGEAGLSVKEISELRLSLRENESEFVAEKKTVLSKALQDAKKDVPAQEYEGSLGVAYGYGDQVSTAKSIYEFSKKHPALKYFGALFDGEFIDESRLTELAKLPGRDALIGQLLGMLNYPITGLVNVLQGNIRGLVVALDQIRITKQ